MQRECRERFEFLVIGCVIRTSPSGSWRHQVTRKVQSDPRDEALLRYAAIKKK